ncbi:hypothetical protein A2422_00030 [Candidatus Woesebacteria bacterium RIFOXYC1_FULL_31_51]|uniref:Uncharacterized protein n=1 Tax=Candidatus Woesebacteria bacterium GW2011_GWC2_31_9 TaxID=1618586 RepID=A0A0F9YIP4_9BACT|nr:MAG: hypothetical protein UR17_C0001G0482 [Candidatus Woesebacteria bacterium GW2011_GWF1_31_35]KKP23048.1 MAG: hypothetical protein UR11_C0001G0022 [Candidatus Woesebacteria bacterium GW2011_GWC1_30_29]KKP25338.1 MAG: hypothetical protein UR13_C0009G0022 [Candidatus Woesebacteria bacterium GW2011_GWD1_31_12]KKP27290.1 MAG: hypothetical protein UR16_C0004G0022 [Candidatus Woesebacteria bacterium GW2011_GWB1_31_29]KKP31223.1 MAG: hypothetical protein UR21_C0013G0017 [Candidatus Woesebacteria 
MLIENGAKVEIDESHRGITHTTVTASNGKIIFDRMATVGTENNNKHFFEVNYHNLIPKKLENSEILPLEVNKYPCGIIHTIKRSTDGKIIFDRMENINKKLSKSYRSF